MRYKCGLDYINRVQDAFNGLWIFYSLVFLLTGNIQDFVTMLINQLINETLTFSCT